MDDWRSKVYCVESWDGGVSVIIPAPDYDGTWGQWSALHELDQVTFVALYPIQLPPRSERSDWTLKDGRVVVPKTEYPEESDVLLECAAE